MTGQTASARFLTARSPLVSQKFIQRIFAAPAGSVSTRVIREDRAESQIQAIFVQGLPRVETTPSARERWLRMAERARERIANAPRYADDPDEVAEQEAVTRAFSHGQARAQAES